MDDLLTPVSTTYTKKARPGIHEVDEVATPASSTAKSAVKVDTPSIALDILKSQPDYDQLVKVLAYLAERSRRDEPPDAEPGWHGIGSPSPQSASLIQALVTDIVPNYWTLLQEGRTREKSMQRDVDLLVSCLQSVAGVNALLLRIRSLIADVRCAGPRDPSIALNLSALLGTLSAVLDGEKEIFHIWEATSRGVDDARKRRLFCQELVATFTSGKISSYAAEAEDVVKDALKNSTSYWISDSREYSRWLGSSIVFCAVSTHTAVNEELRKLGPALYEKCARLPHYDILLRTVAGGLLQHLAENGEASDGFFDNLHQSEQARFFRAIVDLLSNDYVGDSQEPSVRVVSGAAGVIHRMVGKTPERRSFLADWVTNVTSSPAGFRHGVGIRRAVIAILAQDSVALTDVLEKTLGQFGDQWNVRHMADSAQEALAQVVLLSAGYVHRKSPRKLATILRGSVWLNAMSNRMRSSESRTRILGMVVGEALSGLVDKPETRLDFKMEETSSDEARWLKGLVGISDSIGPYKDMLRPKQGPSDVTRTSEPKRTESKQAKPAARSQPSTARPIVEELSDGEGESSDAAADPKPYAKPLHDPEDSDDDPTLVRRDRPKPPVYIRDLIAYLRDTENYDKQKLALTHAPVLIRRKATFGSEVSSHAEELAGLLVGVQDKFDMEGFHDMRQQAMLALLVGLPAQMGPWFAKTFFDGDYSLGQRASILVVLGLAARELAGFDVSPYRDQASFPSQLLPKRVEKLYLDDASARESQLSSNPLLLAANSPYIGPSKKPGAALKALPANAIDHMAADLASSFLAPVAAAAADELAGPNALKLATASSRVASRQQGAGVITRKASPKPKAGVVTRANTTASLLATSFFFPLASRLPFLSSAGTMSFSIDRSADPTSSALLLPLLIKTLALTLHAAGPASAPGGHLREMTRALWGFVLTLRGRAVAEEGGRGGPLLRAMIVSLATLLEVNEAASSGLRRLCEEHPRDVVETAEWLSVVMEGLADGGGEGESPNTRALVAAVLLKLRGMLEEFRLLLVGDLIGYG